MDLYADEEGLIKLSITSTSSNYGQFKDAEARCSNPSSPILLYLTLITSNKGMFLEVLAKCLIPSSFILLRFKYKALN